MQKSLKKSISAILCGAAALTACGCGNTTGTALTIGDKDIRAGVYIYYQMDALSEAATILGEEQPDLDMTVEGFDIRKYTVEGVGVEEWVKNKTIELCKEHTAVDALFESRGLTLSEEEKEEIDQYVFSAWNEENMYVQYIYGVNILGDYYEKLGIGEQSFEACYTNSYKKDALFENIYGEGGEKAVSAEELDAGVIENYALILEFEVNPKVETAQTYVDMINGGTSFTDANAAYEKAISLKEIEDDMNAAKEKGEEYDGILPEEVETVAVDEKDLRAVVERGTESPTKEYVDEVFALAAGETKVITVSDTTTAADGTETTEISYYVVQRKDITTDTEAMHAYRETALHEMKDSEFDDMIKAESEKLAVTENAAAINLYTIDKLEK